MTTLVFRTILLLGLVAVTNSAAFSDPTIFCDWVSYKIRNRNFSFKVCSTLVYYMPSPTLLFPNGTFRGYQGNWETYYYIYRDLVEGTDTTSGNYEPELLIGVILDNPEQNIIHKPQQKCNVTVNNQQCTSCYYCGDAKFKANCLNVPNGRRVGTCSPVSGYLGASNRIFYPLRDSAYCTIY